MKSEAVVTGQTYIKLAILVWAVVCGALLIAGVPSLTAALAPLGFITLAALLGLI